MPAWGGEKKPKTTRIPNRTDVARKERKKVLDFLLSLNDLASRIGIVYKRWREQSDEKLAWIRGLASSALKEATLISALNIPISGLLLLVLRFGFVETLGFVLLLEAVALMLVGGAMDLSGAASTKLIQSIFSKRKEEWKREEHSNLQKKAAVYSLTGVFLFAESLLLAVTIF